MPTAAEKLKEISKEYATLSVRRERSHEVAARCLCTVETACRDNTKLEQWVSICLRQMVPSFVQRRCLQLRRIHGSCPRVLNARGRSA